MNEDEYREQAKNSPFEKTKDFKCPYCKYGRMRLRDDVFRCNKCRNSMSRENGIEHVAAFIKSKMG